MIGIVFRTTPRLTWLLALALSFQLTPSLYAQRSAPGRNTVGVLAAFKEVVARPSLSTVRVLCEGTETALGTVVSPDGWILTKWSDLKSNIVCKLKDGRQFRARVVGVEEKYDLAMLKIEASGLQAIEWRSDSSEVGDWVASTSNAVEPAAIGVVSVASRQPNRFEMGPVAPPSNSGFLGIQLRDEEEGGPIVGVITPGSAAEKAGLKVGDVVLRVAGKKIPTAEQLVATIQRFKPAVIALKVRRGNDELELKATLAKRPNELFNRGDRMNQMGSELSRKRNGFPFILQHDTVLKPKDCGGPLVDLDGKAVGINIARAGRTESYAIPAKNLLSLRSDLKWGKLAPKEDRDETRIAELEGIQKQLRADLAKGEKEMKEILADKKDAAKEKTDLERALALIRKKIETNQTALDQLRKDPTKSK